MGIESVGLIAVSAALGALGAVTRPRPKQRTIGWDEAPTSLATRGAFIPLVIGRAAVAPIFLWAGDRATQGGGGGGKGFGGGGGSALTYDEAAWHGLCLGPIDTLHSIRADSRAIYTGPLQASAGSGVSITCRDPHPGTAYVYFGEQTQPVNSRLGAGSGSGTAGVGVASRWPRLCYVEHRRLRLGTGPQWPNLLYEIERRPQTPDLGSPVWISESSAGAGDDGVNAAHALWDLLTNPFLGAVPCGALNCGCFRDLAAACAADRMAVNMVVSGGEPASSAIAALLAEIGIALPDLYNPDASVAAMQLAPRLVRATPSGSISSLPVLGRSVLLQQPEAAEQQPPRSGSRLVVTFPDRALSYRDQSVTRDDDAIVDGAGRQGAQTIRLQTVTDARTAARIADRRAAEAMAPVGTIRIEVGRGAVRLGPGRQFRMTLPGDTIERVYAVLSLARAASGLSAVINATEVRYGDGLTGPASPLPPAPPAPAALAADSPAVFQEMPFALTRVADPRIGVLRVGGSSAAVRSTVLSSGDNVSFAAIGINPDECFGGTLDAGLAVGPTIIGRSGDGPVITAYTPPMTQAEDLSAASFLADWLGGRQPALIGTGPDAEIVYVRSVTALGANKWRLNQVIRARMDTDAVAWASGTPVLFFGGPSRRRVAALNDPTRLVAGRPVWCKSIPQDSAGVSLDASLVASQRIDVVARAARPLPVCNLRVNGRRPNPTYTAGQDLRVTWRYRVRDGLGQAAGEVSALGRGQPTRDGPFTVEVWSGATPTLRRTIPADYDNTDPGGVLYSAADNAADHGGSPASSIEFRVYCSRGLYVGRVSTITVTRV